MMAIIKRRSNEPVTVAGDEEALVTTLGDAAVVYALQVYHDFTAERKTQALIQSQGGDYYRNALIYLGQAYSFAGDILCALSGCSKEEFADVIPEMTQHPEGVNMKHGYSLFLQYLETYRNKTTRQADYKRWDDESKKEKKKKEE